MVASKLKLTISRLIPITRTSIFINSTSFSNCSNFRRFSSTVDHLNKDQVHDRVFNVLKAFDKVASTAPTFTASSNFTSELGLDSLDVVEVLMAVEEEFGIEIPDEVADNFKTPQEVIEYVHSKLNAH